MSQIIETIHPATGAVLRTYDGWRWPRIDTAVNAAHQAAATWGQQPLQRRVAAVRQLAGTLRAQRDALARLGPVNTTAVRPRSVRS